MRWYSFIITLCLTYSAYCFNSFAQDENQIRTPDSSGRVRVNRTPQSETKDATRGARVYRLRQPESLFTQKGTVHFRKAGVDLNGTIRADGHDLSLYGVKVIERKKICTSSGGARWACGQRVFIAMRMLLNNQPITCSFKQALDPPKAICFLKEEEIAVILLRQGWAELGEGVTEETYIEALDDARSAKAGVWADSPP